MDYNISFIEKQFPVSKVSKESFKERKAVQSQTLTGLGKWWGRKPLFLVRAALFGCIMPVSSNPKKDMEIFNKILLMDKNGLMQRLTKPMSANELYRIVTDNKNLRKNKDIWFELEGNKVKINSNYDRKDIQNRVFKYLSYDEKLKYCVRPEEISNLSSDSWGEINQHLGTKANSISELIQQLSEKKFGHLVTVGDCFSGGGSIPFESYRVGTNVYASDLNPVASLLTWADMKIFASLKEDETKTFEFQDKVLATLKSKINELGIERNEQGDNASVYLYCTETVCPECGYRVPLSSSWVIGKGSNTVAILKENKDYFDIEIKMNASSDEMKTASNGTLGSKGLVCPHCGKTTPISSIRKDRIDDNGDVVYGLRLLNSNEFEYDNDDVFVERLFCIRYERFDGSRYYRAPNQKDIENENTVKRIVADNIIKWQEDGIIPNTLIEKGEKTTEVIRTRGWRYWHQLFNARQLLTNKLLIETIFETANNQIDFAEGILVLNKSLDWNSKLCRWGTGQARESMAQTFYNQALNTLWQYGTRGFSLLENVVKISASKTSGSFESNTNVKLLDARDVNDYCDIWITDPPYADAVNYHELSEYFLAWDKSLIKRAFPEWYTDSKRVLAVKEEHFSETMIDIYANLRKHMPDNGIQIVMFTHSDPAVWAQLAIIMWKAGLKVTAAWNIATETEAAGLKNGNYVKGTVLLVLRKQTGDDEAFLDEIDADIRTEVKKQIESMQALEDKEEPNFSDPDYVLAAYAASLKVLTSYAEIEDLNLDYELSQAISNPSNSEVVKIIENAKRIAYDCVIPTEFENYLWKELSNSERFYIKGLESEKHGNYQIATYQEFARGFSISGYSQLMANEKANTARLKTPYEMAGRTMNDVPDFENSLMRTLFTSIYVGVKEDMNPQKALGYIKGELSDYWDKREMIKQLLSFLVDCKDISNMQPHWTECSKMAELLFAAVTHDSI